jgi:hypothetical protein
MLKKDAITFAKQFGWTGADAERAYHNLDFKQATEQDLLKAMVTFAGPELLERQRLQGAQRGQVTKKNNYIEKIETEFAEKVVEYEETLQSERSTFVAIISRVYKVAKQFGLKDPWVETLISQYEEHQASYEQEAN